MPGTKICVSCLSAKGDVRVVRRFDEQLASGETVQSYYTDDPYIEQQLRHANLKSAAALDEFGHLDACAVITGCDLATLVYEQGVENQRELDEAKES
jgi:hypothetical protein